jgi:very-short-patch-repair endonuclease
MDMCKVTSKKLCGVPECAMCFNRSFASHEKAASWSAKNSVAPINVLKNSNKKYWFDCGECEHSFEMQLHNVCKGSWCKYCNRKELCEDDCTRCFEKSFAAHPLASSWSARNEKTPRQVNKASDKMFYFDCKRCSHTFQSRLFSIKTDQHCSYCSNQALCENDECKYCFEKSCGNHRISSLWSDKNPLPPRKVFQQSNKKVYLTCNVCQHELYLTPNGFVNGVYGCVYCSNQKLCAAEGCILCYNKSFASHEKVGCWSPKKEIAPRAVFKGSNAKHIFTCDKCKCDFESKLFNVLTGYWCPYCKNKTEGKVAAFLTSKFSHYKAQVRFDWCRNSLTNNVMPFDFGLEDEKVLIEVDGPQHFMQIANWGDPVEVLKKDVQKIRLAIEKGYSVIHILQTDIWTDRVNWRVLLENAIEICKETSNQCIFIDSGSTYDAHVSALNGIETAIRCVDTNA